MAIVEGRNAYSYYVSRIAKAGLLFLTDTLCKDEISMRKGRFNQGEPSILPLVSSIGSGKFTVIERENLSITQRIRKQAIEKIRREVRKDIERVAREIEKRERGWIAIEDPEIAGLRSIALNLGYIHYRRASTSKLLEAVGQGELTVLPTIDLRYRELYLNNHPLVREYLELTNLLKNQQLAN